MYTHITAPLLPCVQHNNMASACLWGKDSWEAAWGRGPVAKAANKKEHPPEFLAFLDKVWEKSLETHHGVVYAHPHNIKTAFPDSKLQKLLKKQPDFFWALYQVYPVCGMSSSVHWPSLTQMATEASPSRVRTRRFFKWGWCKPHCLERLLSTSLCDC